MGMRRAVPLDRWLRAHATRIAVEGVKDELRPWSSRGFRWLSPAGTTGKRTTAGVRAPRSALPAEDPLAMIPVAARDGRLHALGSADP
jgi:hypothetical protein